MSACIGVVDIMMFHSITWFSEILSNKHLSCLLILSTSDITSELADITCNYIREAMYIYIPIVIQTKIMTIQTQIVISIPLFIFKIKSTLTAALINRFLIIVPVVITMDGTIVATGWSLPSLGIRLI